MDGGQSCNYYHEAGMTDCTKYICNVKVLKRVEKRRQVNISRCCRMFPFFLNIYVMLLAVRIYSTNIHLPDKADYNKIILGFIDYEEMVLMNGLKSTRM